MSIWFRNVVCCFWAEFIFNSSGFILEKMPCPPPCDNTVIYNNGSTSYVGGAEYLLVIDRHSVNYTKVAIPSETRDFLVCRQFKKHCLNILKIIQPLNSSVLLLCGTNAWRPTCYHFNTQTLALSREIDERMTSQSTWMTAEHDVNTVAALHKGPSGDELYVGTCVQSHCTASRQLTAPLTTKTGSNPWIQESEFVDVFTTKTEESKTYFLFRENSTKFHWNKFSTGEKKGTYGMIARSCQNDQGGAINLRNNWMTFAKIRLLCPYPGDQQSGPSMYFDYMRSSIRLGKTIFVLFNFLSSWNLPYSALCAYSLEHIDDIIDGRSFPKNRTEFYSSSTPSRGRYYKGNAGFLPGQCPGPGLSTKNVDSMYEAFVTKDTLVKKFAMPSTGKPLQIFANNVFRYITGDVYDGNQVLYMLSADGNLRKLVLPQGNVHKVITVSKSTLSDMKSPVKSLSVVTEGLVILLKDSIMCAPLADCSSYKAISKCRSDPHCSWETVSRIGCVLKPEYRSGRDSSSPASLSVDVSNVFITISWKKNIQFDRRFYVAIERLSDRMTVYSVYTSRTTIRVKQTSDMAGWRYRAVVRVIEGDVPITGAETRFTISLKTPKLDVLFVHSNVVLITWNHLISALSYQVTLYREQINRSAEVASYIMQYPDSQPSISFRNLDHQQKYSVHVQAISLDKVYSHSVKATFEPKLLVTSSIATWVVAFAFGIIVPTAAFFVAVYCYLSLKKQTSRNRKGSQ